MWRLFQVDLNCAVPFSGRLGLIDLRLLQEDFDSAGAYFRNILVVRRVCPEGLDCAAST